ncbi:MAG: c-type cytochrome, partial [Desulfuromonadales bacterium]|nr:c-type cytochrome [Desulfuromonadales bacterium]
VLSFPYTAEEIKALSDQNEMDAIVAYMQKLGSDIQWREAAKATILGDLKNPYLDADKATIQSWASIYNNNCAFCHGDKMQGNIGPELIGDDYDDEFLFETIYNGIEGSMQSFSNLGAEKVWKLVNYIRKSPVGIRKSPAGGSE